MIAFNPHDRQWTNNTAAPAVTPEDRRRRWPGAVASFRFVFILAALLGMGG